MPLVLLLPRGRIPPRGAGASCPGPGLCGPRTHRPLLPRRGGPRPRGGQGARPPADHRRRAPGGNRTAPGGPGPGPGRLRQPLATDLPGPSARTQGQVPTAGRGPRPRTAPVPGPVAPTRTIGSRRGPGPRRLAQGAPGRRSAVDRHQPASPRRRRGAARPVEGIGERSRSRRGRRGERGHARPRSAPLAGHPDRHPARGAGRSGRGGTRPEPGEPSAHPRAARPLLSPGTARGHRRAGGALPILTRRAALRVSRRAGPARDLADRPPTSPDRGGCRLALAPGRARTGAPADRLRADPDRGAGLRALFPHRPRHRRLRPIAGHPVPGTGLGGQLGGLLLPGDHRGGPGAHGDAVRALHLPRARRAPGHRRGLRAPAPRGGDPVHL